jgi:hypothetical protein
MINIYGIENKIVNQSQFHIKYPDAILSILFKGGVV